MIKSNDHIKKAKHLLDSKQFPLEDLIDGVHAEAFEKLIHDLIKAALVKGYRFSDVLEALASYADKQRKKNYLLIDKQIGWEIQFCLLTKAAEQAEQEGRELP